MSLLLLMRLSAAPDFEASTRALSLSIRGQYTNDFIASHAAVTHTSFRSINPCLITLPFKSLLEVILALEFC